MSEHSLVCDEVAIESASAGNLVVGHDGSGSADNALLETLKLADQLQIPVSVVRAWSFQTAPRASDWTFGYAPTLDEMQQAVLDTLIRDVTQIVKSFPAVKVTYQAVRGHPAKRLIALSASARMLVVGSRGLGGLAQVVLGSVSSEVIKSARCPVLVTKQPAMT